MEAKENRNKRKEKNVERRVGREGEREKEEPLIGRRIRNRRRRR